MYTPSLDYFLIIAEELNISRAARLCHVTQQSLSNYMQRLEEHYGVRFFLRTPALQLTEQGKQLQKAALEIRMLTDQLQADVRALSETSRSIVIGISNPLGRLSRRFVPIMQLSTRVPQAQISVVEEEMVVLLSQFQLDRIDFLISSAPMRNPEVCRVELLNSTHYLVIAEATLREYFPEAHPNNFTQWEQGVNLLNFAHIPAILYSTGGTTSMRISSFFYSNGVTLSVPSTINNPIGIFQAILEQHAWGYCPSDALPQLNGSAFVYNGAQLRAFPILQPDLSYSVSLSYKRRKQYSPEFKAVLDVLSAAKSDL